MQSGYLKDLGISLRHASLRSEVAGQRDVDEVRAILSYSFVLRYRQRWAGTPSPAHLREQDRSYQTSGVQ